MTARIKKSIAEQLRPFWIIIAVCAAAAAVAGYYAITWRGFHARNITVGGMQVVSRRDVLIRADIDPQKNLWLQNTHAAELRIESIPYVKSASLHRSLPADLRIDLTERTPSAVIVVGERAVLIDPDGRVLETDGLYPSDLPRMRIAVNEPLVAGRFLKDARVARAQRDYNQLLRHGVVTTALEFDKLMELTVRLGSGVRVRLGADNDLAEKAALVEPILQQIAGKIDKVVSLDLRAPRTPVVVYK